MSKLKSFSWRHRDYWAWLLGIFAVGVLILSSVLIGVLFTISWLVSLVLPSA